MRACNTWLADDAMLPASGPGERGTAALCLKSHSNRLLKTIELPIGMYQVFTTA